MSSIVQKGRVYQLKEDICTTYKQAEIIIPKGTKGSIISPSLAENLKPTTIVLAYFDKLISGPHLTFTANDLNDKFFMVRASRDKSIKDWSTSPFSFEGLDRQASLLYKGEPVAHIQAIKGRGVVKVEFYKGCKSTQVELKGLIKKLSVGSSFDPDKITPELFADYFFKQFNIFLKLKDYLSMVS